MTIKRLILIVLTILTIVKVSLSLIASWSQPQIQSRLELYQTNLVLQASEWQGESTSSSADLNTVRDALLGNEPLQNAQEQYQDAREVTQSNLEKAQNQLQQLESAALTPTVTSPQDPSYPPVSEPSSAEQQLRRTIAQLETSIDDLDIELGLLQIEQGETPAALQTWNNVIQRDRTRGETAAVLTGLWSNPPSIGDRAEPQIQQNLRGWFRDRGLSQLYQVQQRQDALVVLQDQIQQRAEEAIFRLAIVAGLPGFGLIVGIGLILFLAAQRLIQGKKAILADNADVIWSTPWDWETIWQVFIVGFFFIGQFVLPLVFQLLPLNPLSLDVRGKAFYVLSSYLLMSTAGLLVLYFSIKPFLPLSKDWFQFNWRGNWILWGLGGYFVAIPLVIVVSLVNQKLWEGQGGSNPILPIALEGRDSVALAIFFATAAIAAPIFEELLFRGFLLPSLTRYVPVWGSILLSGFLFAIAHLSLSEVLPLATLGIILGVVYTRSRNLLAPMLLHSLWNSGTLLSLFVLGGGVS